jgi:hypothetical protein
MLPIGHVPTQIYIYVFSQKAGEFSLKNLVIFQTVDSKAIKTYPNVKKI